MHFLEVPAIHSEVDKRKKQERSLVHNPLFALVFVLLLSHYCQTMVPCLDLTLMKRKLDEHEDARKRLKLTDGSGVKTQEATTSNSLPLLEQEVGPNANEDIKSKGKKEELKDCSKRRDRGIRHPHRRINKLVPPRPFPTVPTSVSATGPRSNHKEGKNLICITRKTSLACYLRRCKDIIIKDG